MVRCTSHISTATALRHGRSLQNERDASCFRCAEWCVTGLKILRGGGFVWFKKFLTRFGFGHKIRFPLNTFEDTKIYLFEVYFYTFLLFPSYLSSLLFSPNYRRIFSAPPKNSLWDPLIRGKNVFFRHIFCPFHPFSKINLIANC